VRRGRASWCGVGWVQVRPSATRGPIIVCLDTSGSMMGARETVAKAMTLECLRQAHAQKRACYVYAFSGPGAVEEMELAVDAASMSKLLQFLTCSFNGGTDADEPLWRSLARLRDAAWADADILMVTDGEIRPPAPELVRGHTHAPGRLHEARLEAVCAVALSAEAVGAVV
jgi:uncharacterized protein with von Willebrand factor type A (vWA) domain